MSEIQYSITELETGLKIAEQRIARRELVLKLTNNPEFRKLIREDYLVTEAATWVQLSQDPNMSKDQREDALNMAQATGHLKRWLNIQIQMGNSAEHDIPRIHADLAELRSMENSEDSEDD